MKHWIASLLLVSALMIVPVAVAQLVASSFHRTMAIAMSVGVVVTVAGLSITYGTAMHGLAERGRLTSGESVVVSVLGPAVTDMNVVDLRMTA